MEKIPVARPMIDQEEINAAVEVLKSGNYTSGKKVAKFETEFAEYLNCPHAVAVNSGTAALHIALTALGIGEGDEVIVPAMTFFSTISAVLMCDAIPVIVDTDLYGNICPNNTERAITTRTRAIIAVHFFGMPCDIDEFVSLSRKYNVALIEDCAQAHGAKYKDKSVGTFGDVGCYSFFATKNMTTLEGGMITTRHPYIKNQAHLLRSHGMTDRHTHSTLGYNYRMNELSGAIGSVQLRKLPTLNTIRISNTKYILENIPRKLTFYSDPRYTQDKHGVYFWLPIKLAGYQSTPFRKHLDEAQIGYRFRYLKPLNKQPIFRDIDFSRGPLYNAEELSGNMIGLPNYPGLTTEQLDRVIKCVNDFVTER